MCRAQGKWLNNDWFTVTENDLNVTKIMLLMLSNRISENQVLKTNFWFWIKFLKLKFDFECINRNKYGFVWIQASIHDNNLSVIEKFGFFLEKKTQYKTKPNARSCKNMQIHCI